MMRCVKLSSEGAQSKKRRMSTDSEAPLLHLLSIVPQDSTLHPDGRVNLMYKNKRSMYAMSP